MTNEAKRRSRIVVALACSWACGPAASSAPITPVAIPVPTPPSSIASTAPPAPVRKVARFDFDHVARVRLKASPAKATAPEPIGEKPTKKGILKEVSRACDTSAEDRLKADSPPYDPRRASRVRTADGLPPGADPAIPLSFEEKHLGSIAESGGKLVLIYGDRWVVVAGEHVEHIIDMDPPDLGLTEEERSFNDVHEAIYEAGMLYVCRGYNGFHRSRKGYVTAIDPATGAMRWRSPAQTCGGTLAVFGDWILTGYGEDVMPYAFKLLRRYDGTVTSSVPNLGAGLFFLVEGPDRVVAETFRHRITYEVR